MPQRKNLPAKVEDLFQSITPDETSALQQKLQEQRAADRNKASITFFEPTYFLPFYYTGKPDNAVYQKTTPLDQNIMHEEFKAQLSLQGYLVE